MVNKNLRDYRDVQVLVILTDGNDAVVKETKVSYLKSIPLRDLVAKFIDKIDYCD